MRRRGAAALAAVLDLAVGEPSTRLHPVGWMGCAISAARTRRWDRSPLRDLAQGAALVSLGAAASALAAGGFGRAAGRFAPVAGTGCVLKPAMALRALLAAGVEVERALRRHIRVAARTPEENDGLLDAMTVLCSS